jgi:hypothetical protein
VIGAELSGLRVTDVLVNVGDSVKRGQPLASIATEGVLADLAQAKASVAEAEAALVEARANAERSKQLQAQGFISSQATIQVVTAEQTAAARLAAARARVQAEDGRPRPFGSVAPDDGVISARTATVGSLDDTKPGNVSTDPWWPAGWRAEVTGVRTAKARAGHARDAHDRQWYAHRRHRARVAPSVDPATRNGLVYVDLPPGGTRWHLRARRVPARQRRRADGAAGRSCCATGLPMSSRSPPRTR